MFYIYHVLELTICKMHLKNYEYTIEYFANVIL